jgi:hypothetical protein
MAQWCWCGAAAAAGERDDLLIKEGRLNHGGGIATNLPDYVPALSLSLALSFFHPLFQQPTLPPRDKHTKHNLGNQQSLCLDVLTSLTHKLAPVEQSL